MAFYLIVVVMCWCIIRYEIVFWVGSLLCDLIKLWGEVV
jgi:hypothetical protein